MYSPDKMMTGKSPLPMSTPGSCFPSRYSPTYRTPSDSMRRCITNPPVSHWSICLCFYLTSVAIRLQKKKSYIHLYITISSFREIGSRRLQVVHFYLSYHSFTVGFPAWKYKTLFQTDATQTLQFDCKLDSSVFMNNSLKSGSAQY